MNIILSIFNASPILSGFWWALVIVWFCVLVALIITAIKAKKAMDKFKVSHFGGWGNSDTFDPKANQKILTDTVKASLDSDGTMKFMEGIGWGSTRVKYQRSFWLIWKVIEGPDDVTPRHCIRILGSKWLLQIKPWKPYGYVNITGKDSPDIP